jgi:hypothetical protein
MADSCVRRQAISGGGVFSAPFLPTYNVSRRYAVLPSWQKLEYLYVVDNDPNLRYIRKLGSGGFGSVHEIFDIQGKKVPSLST